MLDYARLIKRIGLPTGFVAPATLAFENIVASALNREHLREDVAGINASLDLIRRTRGGTWPSRPVTETDLWAGFGPMAGGHCLAASKPTLCEGPPGDFA